MPEKGRNPDQREIEVNPPLERQTAIKIDSNPQLH